MFLGKDSISIDFQIFKLSSRALDNLPPIGENGFKIVSYWDFRETGLGQLELNMF